MKVRYFYTLGFVIWIAVAGIAIGANAQIKVVKTGIDVAYKARIEVSDEIIAFGTGMVRGIDYIRPGDTAGRGIPGGDQFSSLYFAVSGDKIVLANPQEFTISVFDTASQKMTTIPAGRLKLYSVSGSSYEGGGIQSSGNYAVVITDTSGSDDSAIKVLDLTGAEPQIISFKGSGPAFSRLKTVIQVGIDDKSGLAAAATADNKILLLNFRDPSKEPRSIDLEAQKGVGRAQMRFDGGSILFQSGEAYSRAMIVDTATGRLAELTRAVHSVGLRGGTLVYFAERDSKDTLGIVARAAVGKTGGSPVFAAGEAKVDGTTANNGYIGFGSSVAITPDGKQIFIAGREDVGRTERLQFYSGGKFNLVPDASVKPSFMQGADVVASSTLLAFKAGVDNRTTLAYARLK